MSRTQEQAIEERYMYSEISHIKGGAVVLHMARQGADLKNKLLSFMDMDFAPDKEELNLHNPCRAVPEIFVSFYPQRNRLISQSVIRRFTSSGFSA
jgi:hypothetical protein